jgi:hypothetical protein
MTKQELINAMHHVYGNLLLGNILLGFSDSIDWRLLGTLIHEVRSPELVFRADLRPVFRTTTSLRKDQPTMVDEFQKMLRRVAVAESFEALAMYCHQSDQISKFSELSWYRFAKILRNTVSHKQGELIRWPIEMTKKGISSVSWRHRTLDKTMEGTILQFYDAEVLALLIDEIDFVENSLD